MEHVETQIQMFILTIALGMMIGILFDGYSLLRAMVKPRKWLTALGDGLFWLSATIVVFSMLLYGNYGEVRLYVFLGIGIGLTVYWRLFSKGVRRMMRILQRVLWRVCRIFMSVLYYVIWRPLKGLLWLCWCPVRWIGSGFWYCGTKLNRLCNFIHKPPQT